MISERKLSLHYQISDLLAMSSVDRKQILQEDSTTILENMLLHIGHPDEMIRDHQNLRLFLELMQNDCLSVEDKRFLVSQLTQSPYFYFKIGEKDHDSIFQRSLSAMWLSIIIQDDAEQLFLTTKQYEEILHLAVNFLTKEKDTRGYVPGKGWAYGIANGADLLYALIRHPKFNVNMSAPILQSIRDCFWKDTVFVDDEEEKFVEIVVALIRKGTDEKLLIEWVEQVFDSLEYSRECNGYSPLFLKARTQTLHFVKSLYFALKFKNVTPELQGVVLHFISKWM